MLYKTHVFLGNRKCQISMTETRFSTIRDPVLFLQFIKCYGLDINAWDKGFLAKKMQKNVMKNHILKPPTFTLIMLLSIRPVPANKMGLFVHGTSCNAPNVHPRLDSILEVCRTFQIGEAS